MRRQFVFVFATGLLSALLTCTARSAEPVHIAVIETLSSPPAVIGKWWSNHVQWAVDQVNAKGGILGGRKIEIVAFDSKGSPQEALIAFKGVTDQNLRFDAHADMKVDALIRHVAAQKNIGKVYLVNQDYAYGQAVRKLLRELLSQRRPDIQIVGDDLIQLQKTIN